MRFTRADCGIERLQVMGDSKLLMNWANGKNRIKNLGWSPIMYRVSKVKIQFIEISLTHIFREFNLQADSLSKDALLMHEGILSEQEFKDEVLLPVSFTSLCWVFMMVSVLRLLVFNTSMFVIWYMGDRVDYQGSSLNWMIFLSAFKHSLEASEPQDDCNIVALGLLRGKHF